MVNLKWSMVAQKSEVKFSVADWLYLKVQPYYLRSQAKRNEMLSLILTVPTRSPRIGLVEYKLVFPEHIHLVLQLCLLKTALATTSVTTSTTCSNVTTPTRRCASC